MSQYTMRSPAISSAERNADDGDSPCITLAAVIERHLDALARLLRPGAGVSSVLAV
jgi:hypothetical protein